MPKTILTVSLSEDLEEAYREDVEESEELNREWEEVDAGVD